MNASHVGQESGGSEPKRYPRLLGEKCSALGYC